MSSLAEGNRRDAGLFWNDQVDGNREARVNCLEQAGFCDAIAAKITDRLQNEDDPIYTAYRDAAPSHDGLEVDADAVVSVGDDPGAYVMAWLWVTNEQAGIEEPDDDFNVCRTCGEHYVEGGDGYDGECPSCADKTDQKLHPENYED